jgi:RNA polymerase-binding transcription factor DksA
MRIDNKTYGICRTTGKLIPKERLRAVPHTTQTVEADCNRLNQNVAMTDVLDVITANICRTACI